MKRPSTRAIFWTILIVALLLRIIAAVVIDRKVHAEGRQFLIEGDANGYWELGQKIAAGKEYSIYTPPRRVLRTPGFPLLLAACIKVFGKSIFAASLVMAVVGTACCWLTYMLARGILNERQSLWAMLLVAVSPLQIGSNVQILSETWFTFWLLLCLIALRPLLRRTHPGTEFVSIPNSKPVAEFVRIPSSHEPDYDSVKAMLSRAFVCGLLTGLTTLVRPGWILWTGLSAALILVFAEGRLSQRFARAMMIGLGCFVALLPWAWRNHEVTGHWIFTSLWSGPSLYDGFNPGATGASDMTFVDSENLFSTMSEFDANAHYKERAFRFAMENPQRTLELAVLKSARYLSPTLNAVGFSGGPFSLACLVWYLPLLVAITMGALRLRGNLSTVLLLSGPFLQFLLVHMVFVGSVRYRLPVEFPLSVIAAAGLPAILSGWNQTSSRDA
jgi:4-amino-4-deoxy-L-arabinose transferase-like glycosyltransferase